MVLINKFHPSNLSLLDHEIEKFICLSKSSTTENGWKMKTKPTSNLDPNLNPNLDLFLNSF